jgi:hypothetical protein
MHNIDSTPSRGFASFDTKLSPSSGGRSHAHSLIYAWNNICASVRPGGNWPTGFFPCHSGTRTDLGVVDVMFCEIISLEGLFGGEKLDPQKFDYFVTGSCWGDCISQIPFAHNTQQDSKIKILQVWTKYYFQCNHLRLFWIFSCSEYIFLQPIWLFSANYVRDHYLASHHYLRMPNAKNYR